MLTLTCLTISLCCEQGGSGGSSIAGRGKPGFTGLKLVQVDPVSLVGVKLDSLGATYISDNLTLLAANC